MSKEIEPADLTQEEIEAIKEQVVKDLPWAEPQEGSEGEKKRTHLGRALGFSG